MRQKKGFPIWGKLSAKRTDEGKAYVAVIKTGNKANFPLIRRCGATFSLRAKSRLRRLRSDTRLRAQPLRGKPLHKKRGGSAAALLRVSLQIMPSG